MAEMIRIIAAPGRHVRDPGNRNRVIPSDGIDVAKTDPYWFTKIQRGDVVVVQPAQPVQQKPTVTPAAQIATAASTVQPITPTVTVAKPNSQE
jgi:hypothetical protein